MQFDKAVFKWINQWPEWWTPLMRLASEGLNDIAGKVVMGLILLGLIAAGSQTRRAAISSLVAFPLANLLTDIFKKGIPMPRPYNDPDLLLCTLRVGASDSAGTASAHAANMFAVAITMCLHLRWFGVPWMLLALLVGTSRIYNGAHYPYQVLLGYACGAVAAMVVHLIAELIRKKRSSGKQAESQ